MGESNLGLPLIGFGGPLLILLVFQLLFWRGVDKAWLRLVFIYVFSVASGVLSDVVWQIGQAPSALIAGIGAPLFYCIIFTVLLPSRRTGRESTRERGEHVPEVRGWNPTIVAALIQAIATIIAAMIANM